MCTRMAAIGICFFRENYNRCAPPATMAASNSMSCMGINLTSVLTAGRWIRRTLPTNLGQGLASIPQHVPITADTAGVAGMARHQVEPAGTVDYARLYTPWFHCLSVQG